MLKSILNLEGAQGLTKNEQKGINGGISPTYCLTSCPPGCNDCRVTSTVSSPHGGWYDCFACFDIYEVENKL